MAGRQCFGDNSGKPDLTTRRDIDNAVRTIGSSDVQSRSSKVPQPDECVLGPLLEDRVRQQGDKVFAVFADGREWTYRQTLEETCKVADGLHSLGVVPQDRVVVWLPNGSDHLRVWFGVNYIGAVYVPLNIAYRGGILEHVIRNARAETIVAHRDLVPRLAEIDLRGVKRVIVLGGDPIDIANISVLDAGVFDIEPLNTAPAVVAPWDTQMIIYTSGTTGPSKGVLTSYVHTHAAAESFSYMDHSDRQLIHLPMFHVGGSSLSYASLVNGGSVAIVGSFETKFFWDMVRKTQSTTAVLLGVMTPFLLKEPASANDRNHSLRTALMIPLTGDSAEFSQRFGCDIYTGFNMTEVSLPFLSEKNPTVVGTCGRPRDGVEVRLVDDFDCEVPTGSVGELIIRTARPWAMNHGYNSDFEATANAWRNGWFHTGDAFKRDANDNFFFVDRKKDAIRRRGENVSSFEVETELNSHPAIRESAAVAVPGEFSEDEVLAVVSLVEGKQLSPSALIEFLIPRMAHFMVPRYVRMMKELPRTPTQKIEKYLLRRDGVTSDTWDRVAAGIHVKRTRIRT
ncbi:MAG: AMP-binding protein [Xanthobacteraceae bacterium]